MTLTKAQQQEKEEALEQLRTMLKPGDVLYTVLRHVSKSGMNRWIDVYLIEDDTPHWLSGYIGRTDGAGYWDARRQCLRVPGAGMDMGFHVVYSLSRQLWPDGFECTGEDGHGAHRCGSNDHSNPERDPATGERTGPPPKPRKGMHHEDGGYALHHRWLG